MSTPLRTPSSLSLFTRGAVLAVALVSGCSTNLTPTIAELSGRRVELVEAGSGDATVVFESGLGNDWSGWDAAMTEVSASARVFAYSRPGYGRSDPSTGPRDAGHIVEELRALLAARGHAPPYVLVGHSFGGAYMELYAKRHPEEVLGLVMVEPRHRDFTRGCEAAGLDRGTWHLMTGRPYLMRVMGFGFSAPNNPVPGVDLAGTVLDVGEGVTRFRAGELVFGIGQGAFAEYACAREDKLAHKPSCLSLEEAAVLGVSGLTALQSLRAGGDRARTSATARRRTT